MKFDINFSIITPNLNGSEFLKTFLPSLLTAINFCPESKFEIILVDNASTDNSLEIFNKYFLDSKIILLSKNLGFSGAVKEGIAKSKYDYVCLLNNDIVLDQLWFKKITQFISQNKNKNIATICGTVLNKEGTYIESQGLQFFPSGKCIQVNNGFSFDIRHLSFDINLVWGSSGAAVVYKKSSLLTAGSYDPIFFNYLEDVDVSLRLHKSKYKTVCLTSAIAYHLGGGTSSKYGYLRQYYSFRNWLFIIIKNYSLTEFFTNLFGIIDQRLRNFVYLALNCPIYLIPILPLKAFFETIYYLPNLLKSRQ